MEWITLITALLPLIEMLLRLFSERRGTPAERRRLAEKIDEVDRAIVNAERSDLRPAQRRRLERLKARRDAVWEKAEAVGLYDA